MNAKLFQCRQTWMGDVAVTPCVLDVPGRLDLVRKCTDATLLREALTDAGLQKTVRTAIERRLRALEKSTREIVR